jgi:uncharacterized 2Fe-2S/4Fe-4S cluster protein (DUF4445 family)
MSVDITFQPSGLSGIVAQGTYVIDAAKRMGVSVSAACQGREKCTSCVIQVLAGGSLLSLPSDHELNALGQERLDQGQRLGCQTRIEKSGELVIEIMPEQKQDNKKQVRNSFRELSLDKKLATLVELEALTMSEAMDAVVHKALSLGGKVKDLFGRAGTSSRK